MKFALFVIENRRFLAFGFLLAYFGSFGTTPIIALVGGIIRDEFGLSHGEFGTIYSLATLASAIFLIWAGRLIDTLDLRLYSALVCLVLVGGCLALALASGPVVLLAAIFVLRLAGPGLMNHIASTSMVRYLERNRGKALSISGLGQPTSEFVVPSVMVALMAAIGWRASWLAIGAFLVVVVMPVVLWLLRGHGRRHGMYLSRIGAGATAAAERRQWSRREVVRDPQFYLILPAVLTPPAITAGLFFHQVYLVESKGWSLAWWAACFMGYAIARVSVSLASGPAIDRFGATLTLPVYLLPLTLALLALAFFDHPIVALVYLMLAGLSTGARITSVNAVWAEVYGVAHVGAIRALVQALIMFAVALSPATMGWLFDLGIGIKAIVLGGLALVGVAAALFFVHLLGRPSTRTAGQTVPRPQPATRSPSNG